MSGKTGRKPAGRKPAGVRRQKRPMLTALWGLSYPCPVEAREPRRLRG
jgi:hypothetical protein